MTILLEMEEESHAIHLYDLVLDVDPQVLTGLDIQPLPTGEGATHGLFTVIDSVVNDPAQPGKIALTATIGVDTSRAIRRSGAIAKLQLRAVGPAGSTSAVSWRLCNPINDRCANGTVLRSRSPWDEEQGNKNVLGAAVNAEVTVVASGRRV